MYKIYSDDILLCDSRIDDLAVDNPTAKLSANSAGVFSFVIPSNHPRYDNVEIRKSIISVIVNDDLIFRGIATAESKDFFKQKTISCEGELTYFNDSLIREDGEKEFTIRAYLQYLLAAHNSQVEQSKNFELGVVTVEETAATFKFKTDYKSTMEHIKSMVNEHGGFVRVRYADGKRYIDYLGESPKVSNQKIELGRNLLDYTSNIDETKIVTNVVPLGAKGDDGKQITIKSVNGGNDNVYNQDAVNTYGWVTKSIVYNDITSPADLKTKGIEYLNSLQYENVTLTVSAIDFGLFGERFDLFHVLDEIEVVSVPHGMDKRFMLTEMTLNLNNPEQNVIKLGKTEHIGITTQTQTNNDEIKKLFEQVPTSESMQEAINNATALITGSEGGHVLINRDSRGKPFEILIMDTEDITTAQKIWRWNSGGFGYSSKGYAGPYETAITMDGSIVASFITAGILSGVEINNGNGTFKVDTNGALTATNATITNGFINCGGKFVVDSAGNVTANSLSSNNASITGGNIVLSSESAGSAKMIVKTANGNPRIEIGGGVVRQYDANGNEVFNLYALLGSCTVGTIYSRNDGYVHSNLPIIFGADRQVKRFSVGSDWKALYVAATWLQDNQDYAYGITWWQSDERLKENIKPTDESGLDFVNALNHVQFDWKDEKRNNSHVKLGLIAQEVEELDSNCVTHVPQPDGGEYEELLQIDESSIIPYMSKAIQELHEIVKSQQAEIEALKEALNG